MTNSILDIGVATVGDKLGHCANVAQIVTAVAALFAAFIAWQQLPLLISQMEQSNVHLRWKNYNELNQRYAEHYQLIPSGIASKFSSAQVEFQPSDMELRWGRQYFDLCSEEFWLHEQNLLPPDMWEKRILPGIAFNFKQHPRLVGIYKYWLDKGAFESIPKFREQIDFSAKK